MIGRRGQDATQNDKPVVNGHIKIKKRGYVSVKFSCAPQDKQKLAQVFF